MLLRDLFAGELPKLVMFDLDGTLIDSVPDLAAAVDVMLRQLGRDPAGDDQVRHWVGNGARVLVRRALAGGMAHEHIDEGATEQALALFLEAYAGDHSRSTVYPGVRALLDQLQADQVPLALVTNKPSRFVPELLADKQLDGYFRWLVGGDTLPVQKPDPAALNWVMQQAAVSAAQALFVGDSRSDVLAARAAGVPVVAVSYGYNHGQSIATENPDLLVDSLDALI
ncbi:phosphoglycolate phosphatase [Pseudomonas abyssi]|uniref:Phosphoglycolate phosphatase n=2 Tax=Pseudomonas abyssi TaxID=170540 RepID=A0A2A3MIA7_9PSED|nr:MULTISPECIES: phosphoglycolate phosphatase [Pseudomonadaceae]MAD00580.1 phosphoglycolate phosphatase [Pseudomonadales bacterium]MAG67636.1 phosphoglycolate phosphatase [Pseudomonadales bacterium]PBK04549.1 phosphoglycolate phosphatase [Pseudomonas abyssi]RGP55835.1 phosphoglycolate phosphatase [Halopseudomonas gallaeciensis]|tara:strand:+ start:3277 stop:3954 length:678 start_codon:yes stop_codon:yes gene_type:complete